MPWNVKATAGNRARSGNAADRGATGNRRASKGSLNRGANEITRLTGSRKDV